MAFSRYGLAKMMKCLIVYDSVFCYKFIGWKTIENKFNYGFDLQNQDQTIVINEILLASAQDRKVDFNQ